MYDKCIAFVYLNKITELEIWIKYINLKDNFLKLHI